MLVPLWLTEKISLEIWTYEPQSLLRSWTIDAASFAHCKNKYKIVEKQWSIIFVLADNIRGVSENK